MEHLLVNSTHVKAAGVALALFLACLLTKWIMTPWFEPISLRANCIQQDFSMVSAGSQSKDGLTECLERTAKLFLDKDYAETKDLAKTFLTLLSAALVASITFSEKIVDIHNSKRTPLLAMLSCWLLLLLAIVFTGSGLASMTFAAGYAAYHPSANFWHLEFHAVNLFIAACLSFGFGLFALITAGTISLVDKRTEATRQDREESPAESLSQEEQG